jgi:K(+)-stimulated pyrophosphate-energized sodium pump
MNLVALLIVPAVVKYSVGKDQSNPIRIAIALVAVAILVAVIWISKRRGSALMNTGGDDEGATPPANAPAASVTV